MGGPRGPAPLGSESRPYGEGCERGKRRPALRRQGGRGGLWQQHL
ncbi:hypothetical protein HMPREF0262_01706 [Clostridium sp. ATCC 29733]|nr:hypothetical protein HMPREF0262_01706 [Clostridium sp. ATCC 29733]